MGVFSDNMSPPSFNTGLPPVGKIAPGVQAGPATAQNKPMDIRAQANRAKTSITPRQVLWNQMMSGTSRSAAHKLVTHRNLIDRFIDKVFYGTSA